MGIERGEELYRRSNPHIAIKIRHLDQGGKDSLTIDPLEKVTLDGQEKFTYFSSLLCNEEREYL